jgi:hypothetical protein
MRIEATDLRNGTYTDGTLQVEIAGLGVAAAGAPESFSWRASQPIALVIVRSGLDGDDVAFHVGPTDAGEALGARVGDGAGIHYVAFCYDAAPEAVSHPAAYLDPVAAPAEASAPPTRRIAAAIVSTRRQRRSILALLLQAGSPA